MKFYKEGFIFVQILFLTISFICLFLDLNFNLVGFSFFVNILFSLFFLLILLKKNISSIIFFYIFNLIFFCVIPWIQYESQSLIWSGNKFNDGDYLSLNIIVFISNLLILFFYKTFDLRLFKKKDEVNTGTSSFTYLVCVFCFLMVLFFNDFSFKQLIFRGIEGEDYLTNSSPIFTILYKISLILPAFLFIKYFLLKKYLKSSVIFLFVLMCAFPLAIPRFWVAYIYLPILLCLFPKIKRSVYISFIMFFSIILIFPFLNEFRYFSKDKKINFIPDINFFNEGHFDAYQNFMEVLRINFISYGEQLLGVLLFFIPRKFWLEKPVGSGYQMAVDLNYSFYNISMPYLAEGYVNFGYFGLLLFILILSFFMKYIDDVIMSDYEILSNSYLSYYGFFLCAALFFILRGDLLSSFSNLLAGVVAFYLAKKI